MPKVVVEHFIGDAGEFHARELPVDRDVHVWWFDTDVDALVLGSTQDDDVVDLATCRRKGVRVVRRRSGGGLVLLTRRGTLWLDIVLPVDHPSWDRDLTSSMFWLGELWMEALGTCGIGSLEQHRSRLDRSPVSDLVCFAGRGPGEVFLTDCTGSPGNIVGDTGIGGGIGKRLPFGPKVVGISQRRTRTHARFQSVVSIEWEPQRLVDLVVGTDQDRDALRRDIAHAGSSLVLEREQLVEVMTDLLVEHLG